MVAVADELLAAKKEARPVRFRETRLIDHFF